MPSAWETLQGLPAWRVVTIPRPSTAPDPAAGPRDPLAAQRLAALTAAYHTGRAVAFGWIRDSVGGPVQVLTAGPALAAWSDRGAALLTLPAGGHGTAIGGQAAAGLAERLPCWMRIAGTADGLLAGPAAAGDQAGTVRPTLDDGLLATWPGPFGWLLVAEPVPAAELDELLAAAAHALGRGQKYDSPKAQLTVRRLEQRHLELGRSRAAGLWHIRLLAGAATRDAAAQVAGLVCASADLADLPYALQPLPGGGGAAEALDAARPARTEDPAEPVPSCPFAGSSALLAALARPPAREVPGVRFVLRPEFDLTPEVAPERRPDGSADGGADGPAGPASAEAGIPLGQVLDRLRMPAGPLRLPLSSLNRHVFVCGATGAGKSQTVRGLLQAATAAGIPWLVVEPAKAEYKLMAARLRGVDVVRIAPGAPDEVPAGINPLEPATGPGGTRFPLQAHADLVRALFLAAFEAEEPFPQVLSAALTRSYAGAGWDLALGEPAAPGLRPGYPTLGHLQAVAGQVVNEIGYGREVTDNVRGFITVRLSSLRLGTTGRFFEGGHPLDMATLLDRNVVLEIEDIGDDADKAFLIGTVLIRLAGYLRMRQREEGPAAPRLRHLTVIEEAHRLLRHPQGRTGPAAHAVEMFAGLLAEVRAYGEGLVIAEQIPAKLIPDVIKNTAVKIVHRLPAADDRAAVGATMNLTEPQSQYLVTLTPGEAAVFSDGMDYPLLTRMPDGTAVETSAPAVTRSPETLAGRRSPSCGPACRAAACTLRQIRAAERAAETDPRITVWAELSVLAHLTGWTMPMPGTGFAAALRAMDTRLRDCALAHAADAAAAARAAVIASRVSVPDLAAHVTAAMRAALDERRWLCQRAEPAYLAPCYRWALVRDGLRTCDRKDSSAGPHPDSAAWAGSYGRPIPGDTCAQQLAAVERWFEADQREAGVVQAVAFGTGDPAAVERAAGARRVDGDWDSRLADVLGEFRDCRWPADYLRPS
jgi:DNA helicase HerA-like ATPase